ncbi:penicillin-binding protein 1B [Methylomarinum sp. Ch1-1]|uniref:Penicillin-binding protein 1B n=2 Tax=Methylomarinum roseum TaxID=3067653 RepID=A0AAU7NRC2_9GAMM
MSWLKKTLLYSLIFAGFVFFSYLGYLDYTVRKQFAGKRWSIPARVYASPVELYTGYELSLKKFEELLSQLNYRHDYHLASQGTYYVKKNQVYLKTKSFDFWDTQQNSQSLKISFHGSRVDRIINLSNSGNLAIYRMDPVQIGSFYPTRKEDRILIKLENTPDALIQGLLATEDRDFYQHFGVSFKAIARAIWANLKAGGVVQGGSTITQQLVKNFYLTSERSLWRKANEALMALILEYRFNKDDILEAYLNEIYLGQDGASAVHGFGLASEFYFGRPLENLSLHQIATLVALVRGPSYYDPRRYPDRAVKRRNLVLDEMQHQGFITKRQAQAAKHEKLAVISRVHRSANRYPAFLDLVKRQLRQEYREEDLTSEGLRVFTTLDVTIQNELENTLKNKLPHLEKKSNVNKLESAAVVTSRDSAEIVALAGSRHASSAGFNRALDAIRPIGSLIKPVVYLTALEYPNKYTITTKIDDAAIEVKGPKGKDWNPKNYDNQEHGEVELHTALSHSYNLATVRVGMDVGIARTAKTLRNMGVSREVDLFPSLLLGASPLTPLEVTQMYQTLAGDGFASPLRSIRAVIAADGERLQSYPYTVRQTIDPAVTYITNTILQEVMNEGTGRSAYLYLPKTLGLAGKTGTTNKLRDSWFAGFSGDYLSVVWLGRDDNKPAGLTGASGALQVWIQLMKEIAKQPVNLIPPDNIEMQWIDPETGLLANEHCAEAHLYPFVQGSAPTETSPCVETAVDKAKHWFNDFLQDNF